MEVLDQKFDLPLTKQEIRDKQADERLNIKTQESATLDYLESIETENKNIKYPVPGVKLSDDLPYERVELENMPNPEDEEKEVVPSSEEEEDEVTQTLPQFQFRKITTLPDGLLNMPSHAGEIEMMAQGQGIKNIAPQTGWARVWKFLDTPTAPTGFDPTYDFLFKSRLSQEGFLRATLIATSYATPPGGIYKYNGETWDSLVHDYGAPFERDNELLILNAWRSVTSGSPVDKYDIDTASWSKLSGDLPALEAGDRGVSMGCLHNGLMYIITKGKVLKETGSGWDVVYEADPAFNNFYGIGSNGTDLFLSWYDATNPDVNITFTRLSKLSGGSLSTIKELDGNDYVGTSIGYGSNSEKLYWPVHYCLENKIDYYSSDGVGATKILSAIDGVNMDMPVASGPKYDYLSVGDSVCRVDDSLTPIFTDGFKVGSLIDFDEQICIGGQNLVFHTDWEGTNDVRGATTHSDTKFDLGGAV